MPFTISPIEVEALRKLERDVRRIAGQKADPDAHYCMTKMADLLGSVLDRAEFDNVLTKSRENAR